MHYGNTSVSQCLTFPDYFQVFSILIGSFRSLLRKMTEIGTTFKKPITAMRLNIFRFTTLPEHENSSVGRASAL